MCRPKDCANVWKCDSFEIWQAIWTTSWFDSTQTGPKKPSKSEKLIPQAESKRLQNLRSQSNHLLVSFHMQNQKKFPMLRIRFHKQNQKNIEIGEANWTTSWFDSTGRIKRTFQHWESDSTSRIEKVLKSKKPIEPGGKEFVIEKCNLIVWHEKW